MSALSAAGVVLQTGGLLAGPLGRILSILVVVGLVILVGRIVLKIAWRLVTIAAAIIGLLLLIMFFLPRML